MRLKEHILPRIKAMLNVETPAENNPPSSSVAVDKGIGLDGIHFKDDRMYQHSIMCINYTTYDVRRAQDSVNPNTDHNNIMLLSGQDDGHEYLYARVLGIYHVKVIYTGPGMLDYHARRVEFLWVRWFEHVDDEPVQAGWTRRQLDRVRFLPINDQDAFGFVDPAHVLRGSHIIQDFSAGRRYADDVGGVSTCARDAKDWRQYLVNRSVYDPS